MLEERILIESDDENIADEIEYLLDDAGIEFDWDMGGRLMVSPYDLSTVENILTENDIDYSVI